MFHTRFSHKLWVDTKRGNTLLTSNSYSRSRWTWRIRCRRTNTHQRLTPLASDSGVYHIYFPLPYFFYCALFSLFITVFCAFSVIVFDNSSNYPFFDVHGFPSTTTALHIGLNILNLCWTMSSNLYITVISWLSNIQRAESMDSHADKNMHAEAAAPDHSLLPPTDFCPQLTSDGPSREGLSFPFMNSFHRSTWELLELLPTSSDVNRLLPILPTHTHSLEELAESLPNETKNSIVSRWWFI